MKNSEKISTDFYRWEGDACRLHTDERGQQTADIYRGGSGLLPIAPADLLWSGVEISESEYKELVREEIELSKGGAV